MLWCYYPIFDPNIYSNHVIITSSEDSLIEMRFSRADSGRVQELIPDNAVVPNSYFGNEGKLGNKSWSNPSFRMGKGKMKRFTVRLRKWHISCVFLHHIQPHSTSAINPCIRIISCNNACLRSLYWCFISKLSNTWGSVNLKPLGKSELLQKIPHKYIYTLPWLSRPKHNDPIRTRKSSAVEGRGSSVYLAVKRSPPWRVELSWIAIF